jgi:2-deoxy-D-gluconate 3-dehydrogenase
MRRFDSAWKVVVVTGGNGGIGLGMARGLAERGAAVVVAGRNAAKNGAAATELARLGGAASAVVADATDEGRCPRMMAEAVRRHGRPGILVNNTGQARGKPPHAFPVAEWRAALSQEQQPGAGEPGRPRRWRRSPTPATSSCRWSSSIPSGCVFGLR